MNVGEQLKERRRRKRGELNLLKDKLTAERGVGRGGKLQR